MSGGDDTIVAVATAAGRGAVGILRLSGGDAFSNKFAEFIAGLSNSAKTIKCGISC